MQVMAPCKTRNHGTIMLDDQSFYFQFLSSILFAINDEYFIKSEHNSKGETQSDYQNTEMKWENYWGRCKQQQCQLQYVNLQIQQKILGFLGFITSQPCMGISISEVSVISFFVFLGKNQGEIHTRVKHQGFPL